jgi:hypothetical protein
MHLGGWMRLSQPHATMSVVAPQLQLMATLRGHGEQAPS